FDAVAGADRIADDLDAPSGCVRSEEAALRNRERDEPRRIEKCLGAARDAYVVRAVRETGRNLVRLHAARELEDARHAVVHGSVDEVIAGVVERHGNGSARETKHYRRARPGKAMVA